MEGNGRRRGRWRMMQIQVSDIKFSKYKYKKYEFKQQEMQGLEDGKGSWEVLTSSGQTLLLHTILRAAEVTCKPPAQDQADISIDQGGAVKAPPLTGRCWQLMAIKRGGVVLSMEMWPLINCLCLSGWPYIVHRQLVLIGYKGLLVILIFVILMK